MWNVLMYDDVPYERSIESICARPTQAGHEGTELGAETRIHVWIPAWGSADDSRNISYYLF